MSYILETHQSSRLWQTSKFKEGRHVFTNHIDNEISLIFIFIKDNVKY